MKILICKGEETIQTQHLICKGKETIQTQYLYNTAVRKIIETIFLANLNSFSPKININLETIFLKKKTIASARS